MTAEHCVALLAYVDMHGADELRVPVEIMEEVESGVGHRVLVVPHDLPVLAVTRVGVVVEHVRWPLG